eukprot:superscaffoldBa00001849_g12253
MMLHIHFVKVDHESLLVIGSLGIQVSSSYASGRETTSFIEMSKIKDIVINEAIYMHQIIYYLCVLLKDSSDPNAVSSVVPLFQATPFAASPGKCEVSEMNFLSDQLSPDKGARSLLYWSVKES